ncbi:hypothetical protein J2X65_003497 [Ancylobacter sp. 3268]|uniref:hypothetical protein n=1 Tax=Ancylobacter sp. 3268 TaxID=2817752 RepID=UPI0028658CCE|nr:hypothetical protein [Ancylobacter sp. 3268]MDR6954129.1 hypothetical protein [Ancylobacter sp. 3268]
MSIFDRLDRSTSRAVDRVNAIAFRIDPTQSTPNGRPQPDPTRITITGYGIFDFVSVEYGVQLGVRRSYREANDLRALQVGRDPQLSIDRRYFDNATQREPRQGDIVTFTKNCELPKFEVVSVQRDGLSRLVLEMAMIGGQV